MSSVWSRNNFARFANAWLIYHLVPCVMDQLKTASIKSHANDNICSISIWASQTAPILMAQIVFGEQKVMTLYHAYVPQGTCKLLSLLLKCQSLTLMFGFNQWKLIFQLVVISEMAVLFGFTKDRSSCKTMSLRCGKTNSDIYLIFALYIYTGGFQQKSRRNRRIWSMFDLEAVKVRSGTNPDTTAVITPEMQCSSRKSHICLALFELRESKKQSDVIDLTLISYIL